MLGALIDVVCHLGGLQASWHRRLHQTMGPLELFLLALSMAMDAFAVSLVAGSLPQIRGFRPAFRISFHFGLFQLLMPILGWIAGSILQQFIGAFDHWAAFGLLCIVGIRMIWSARSPQAFQLTDPSRGWVLVALSLAVSVDALAVGLSLGVLRIPVGYPALVIGIVTGGLSVIGLRIGAGLRNEWGTMFQAIGGMVLMIIGLHIVLSHLLPG